MNNNSSQKDVLNDDDDNSIDDIVVFKSFKNVINEWKKNVRTTSEDIEMSKFTVTKDGKRYHDGQKLDDGRTVKFGEEKNDDREIASWFKKNIWKDVKFQQRIDYPPKISTPDLVLTKPCDLLKDQTIEIKKVSSINATSFYNRLKRTEGKQSSNILYDISNYDFSNDEIMKQVNRSFNKLGWLDTLLIKKDNDLLFVFKRNKKKETTSRSL